MQLICAHFSCTLSHLLRFQSCCCCQH